MLVTPLLHKSTSRCTFADFMALFSMTLLHFPISLCHCCLCLCVVVIIHFKLLTATLNKASSSNWSKNILAGIFLWVLSFVCHMLSQRNTYFVIMFYLCLYLSAFFTWKRNKEIRNKRQIFCFVCHFTYLLVAKVFRKSLLSHTTQISNSLCYSFIFPGETKRVHAN